MTSAELPPLSFDNGELRLDLFSEFGGRPPSQSIESPHDADATSYPQLTSACYSDPKAATRQPAQFNSYDQEIIEDPIPETPPQQDAPTHPISSLQTAFAESLEEVTTGTAAEKPCLRELDAKGRREALLAQDDDEGPYHQAWRFRAGQTQHEVPKLISQISFGVYLLLNGMANDNTQVVDILQGHIDEVDEFLEVTLEDIAVAQNDLTTRIEHLMLPLSNIPAFEQMLEDRNYRAEILQGNQVIEHVVARTNVAMRQWEDDIEAGLQSSAVFVRWLNQNREGKWRRERPDLSEVFDAMNGNAEGWLLAFEKMSDSAQDMTNMISRLVTILANIEKTAGEVSRRTWANIAPFSALPANTRFSTSSPTSTSSYPSPQRSIHHTSMGSGSFSMRPLSSTDGDDTDTIDFPLPGCIPLMPPPLRITPSNANLAAANSLRNAVHEPDSAMAMEPQGTQELDELADVDENETVEPLFLLQPRTYTPQLPAPLPSPLVKDETSFKPEPELQPAVYSPSQRSSGNSHASSRVQSRTLDGNPMVQKRTSLRQRVSIKANPPGDIHIPPRTAQGMDMYANSPGNSTTRTTSYGSGSEMGYNSQHASREGSYHSNLSPHVFPIPSPNSDHQRYYHPIIASPHSPLQQRPYTAAGNTQSIFQGHNSMLMPPQQLRSRPSDLGGMSTRSNFVPPTYDARASGISQRSRHSEKVQQPKKKRSAFGWFKKAFSMDEEEKAAFQARKTMQYTDNYRDSNGPRFLDGRRVRQ